MHTLSSIQCRYSVKGGAGEFKGRREFKKIQTSQMLSQNESMQEVSSKSDNEKVFKIRGKGLEGREGTQAEENFVKNMQTSQFPSQNESMQEVSSKSENGKLFKNRGKILGSREGLQTSKIQTSQIQSPNKSMQEVSSKSDNPNRTEQVLDLHQFT